MHIGGAFRKQTELLFTFTLLVFVYNPSNGSPHKWCRIYVTNETWSNLKKSNPHFVFRELFDFPFSLVDTKGIAVEFNVHICKARQRVKNCNYCHSKLHTKQSATKILSR